KPASFSVNQPRPEQLTEESGTDRLRHPRAVTDLEQLILEKDVFALSAEEEAELEALDPAYEPVPRRGWSLSRILFGALGILVSFAVAIWVEDLIRALFTRADWLGWTAFGVAMVALLAFIAIIIRELAALRRLTSVQHLRKDAADAAMLDEIAEAR